MLTLYTPAERDAQSTFLLYTKKVTDPNFALHLSKKFTLELLFKTSDPFYRAVLQAYNKVEEAYIKKVSYKDNSDLLREAFLPTFKH